jgi:hypothetical protein
MMWIHRGLNDSLLYCALCNLIAQDDVIKDSVVFETKGTIQGYIFSCIYVQKKIHYYYYYYYYYYKQKTEVVNETQTFDRTKNSEQCVQKDRVR